MSVRKIVATGLCCSLLLSYNPAGAISQKPEAFGESTSITMNDILSGEEKIIYTSEETLYYPEDGISAYSGQYPISTRVRTIQSSSSGIKERDSAIGTFSSIASIALSFVNFPGSMTVATIFSVVGLTASASTYSQAKTFTSYVQYQKQAEAKWADDSSYSPWVFSGKRNYYKHVLAGTQNSSGQWTTKSHDYLSDPAYTAIGSYYNKSDSWFKEEARKRIQNGLILTDLPW